MTEVEELRAWVTDLQSCLFINCVYCGHRYGPANAQTPADVLRRHIASCPKHPMSELLKMCKASLHFIEKGVEPRFVEQWPAIKCAAEHLKIQLRGAIERATE